MTNLNFKFDIITSSLTEANQALFELQRATEQTTFTPEQKEKVHGLLDQLTKRVEAIKTGHTLVRR